MERIKVFISYLLTIVITILLTYFIINNFIYSSINYKNINKTLNKNRIDYLSIGKVTVSDEIYDYLDIDDIVNDYIANKTMYELGMIEKDPKMDKELINKKVKKGLDNYIDYRISQAEGDLTVILDQVGLNKEIKDNVIEELNKKYNIDYNNSEIVKEEDLEKVYNDINKSVDEYEDYLSIFKIFTNKEYRRVSIIVIIVLLLLIAIINFNIIAIFLYTIVPLVINIILLVVTLIASCNINFSGNDLAKILNDIMGYIFTTSIEYLVVLAILLFVNIIIYFIIKNINIVKSHKKGKATLDTLFDDYYKDKNDETSE